MILFCDVILLKIKLSTVTNPINCRAHVVRMHLKMSLTAFLFIPVVGAGDQNLFTSIYPTLSQQLPREPMEWRRCGKFEFWLYLPLHFLDVSMSKRGSQS